MRCAIFASLSLASVTAQGDATGWQLDGELSLGVRHFLQETPDPRQDQFAADAFAQFEGYRDWSKGRHRVAFSINARADTDDGERSRADIQELNWRYRWRAAELAVGIDRVFWGVTEALHLVDVINQTDLAGNPNAETKLGQPMVRITVTPDWGTIDAYLMPLFRERRFPGSGGRLRGPVQIVADAARFESGDRRQQLDLAVRYSHYLGPVDFAISHFSGTARTPAFELLSTAPIVQIAPVYFLTDQTGLEVSWAAGDWLWKLEAVSKRDPFRRYTAATGGFEYTWTGVAGNADVGLIAEYQYDERGTDEVLAFDNAGLFNDDIVIGGRLGLNDFASTEMLVLVTRDRNNGGRVTSIEASRRFAKHWRVALEGQHFSPGDDADLLAVLAREDFWQLTLTRYF